MFSDFASVRGVREREGRGLTEQYDTTSTVNSKQITGHFHGCLLFFMFSLKLKHIVLGTRHLPGLSLGQ